MKQEEDIYNYTPTKDTHCVKPIATVLSLYTYLKTIRTLFILFYNI